MRRILNKKSSLKNFAASLLFSVTLVAPLVAPGVSHALPAYVTAGAGLRTVAAYNPLNKTAPVTHDSATKNKDCGTANNCSLIKKYVNPLINFLAALVGVAVVISIVLGGIQYSGSAGNPQAATVAKNRIRNAIIALIAFLFLYASLNFLIPGGLGVY